MTVTAKQILKAYEDGFSTSELWDRRSFPPYATCRELIDAWHLGYRTGLVYGTQEAAPEDREPMYSLCS